MKSLLICHRGALGDFILTWPAILAVREGLPEYQIIGLGRIEYLRLASFLGLVEKFFSSESARFLQFFSGGPFPPEIDYPNGALLWLSEGEKVLETVKKISSLPAVLIDPFPSNKMHVALHHLLAVKAHFPIRCSYPPCPYIQLSVKKKEYALIHPGSGSKKKNFPSGFYRNIADILKQYGYQDVRFLLGPAEENMADDFPSEKIEQPADTIALAKLLASALLYIGNDSGVSHLAGVLGAPAIIFYKSTDPDVWGVLGRKVMTISSSDDTIALAKMCEGLSGWSL